MKKIKFYKWYRRHFEDRTQYFMLTPLHDYQKNRNENNFGFIMYSKDDNIYEIFEYGVGSFNKDELEKGGMYTKAGDFEEFYDFEAHIPWIIFGQKSGQHVIKSIFEHH